MVLIVDPDDLNQGVEVTITQGSLEITLNTAGNLSDDGVTGQALYSFLKEEWRTDATLIAYPFPMEALTAESFEFINDWRPANDATRNLLRNCGWAERDSGTIVREYAGAISLGTLGGSDQPYYENAGSAVDFNFAGPINEAVQIFGGPLDGNFDRRSTLNLFAREQAKTYASSDLAAIGVTTLTYQAYRFPLANAADLKITASDATIDTTTPYTGMSITFYATPQSRNIGGTNRDFGVIVDGNNGTAEQIYEFVQRQLRQTGDIDDDASTLVGKLAPELMVFVGDNLNTNFVTNPDGGGGGVYIDNFNSNDTNRLSFQDNTNTARTFPFVAAGSLSFSQTLVDDTDAVYRMFFTTNPAGDFGTDNAVLVDNNAGTDISGTVGGSSSIAFDFDYDGNTQGGRTAGTDADVTIVAIGLDGAQYVIATGTITRAVGQNFSLVSALERNYENP